MSKQFTPPDLDEGQITPTTIYISLQTFVTELDSAYQWIFRQADFFKELGPPSFNVSPVYWNFPVTSEAGEILRYEPRPAYRLDFQIGTAKNENDKASGIEASGYLGEEVNRNATDSTEEGGDSTEADS